MTSATVTKLLKIDRHIEFVQQSQEELTDEESKKISSMDLEIKFPHRHVYIVYGQTPLNTLIRCKTHKPCPLN